MNKIRLENWAVVYSGSPYQAPELQIPRLVGNVFGHPSFEDGEMVTTSSIKRKDGECIVTNSGSYYTLGGIDPEYEKQFPNAKQRLMNSLRQGVE